MIDSEIYFSNAGRYPEKFFVQDTVAGSQFLLVVNPGAVARLPVVAGSYSVDRYISNSALTTYTYVSTGYVTALDAKVYYASFDDGSYYRFETTALHYGSHVENPVQGMEFVILALGFICGALTWRFILGRW